MNDIKVIVSHPTGNANVRAVCFGFFKGGILLWFNTTIASFPGSLLYKLGSLKLFSEVRRRSYVLDLQPFTKIWPLKEIGRLISKKIGWDELNKHGNGIFSTDSVYKDLDRRTASLLRSKLKDGIDGVYAYEDGAELTFREAKKNGVKCLYDLPIGYWRTAHKLLKAESERWPEWASTLNTFKDTDIKLKRKDHEIELADCIFVASSFTALTLENFPGKLPKIEIIPYGFPEVGAPRDYNYHLKKRPLKLLFVGGLSQRKGIADLFSVADQLANHVDLTVVGKGNGNDCAKLDIELSKHTWIPGMPHHEVLKLMRQHDLLVFPSLFEGFGMVITEAMSQGTPVITTERTVGPDLITNGVNGWLTKAGSTEELYHSIVNIIDNPSLVQEAGLNAMETARLRPWDVYQRDLTTAVKKYITETTK